MLVAVLVRCRFSFPAQSPDARTHPTLFLLVGRGCRASRDGAAVWGGVWRPVSVGVCAIELPVWNHVGFMLIIIIIVVSIMLHHA